MQEKVYDIGLACVANLNIGNNLTNYALYQYLCDLNYHVLVICNPLDLPPGVPDSINDRFRLFIQIPYSKKDVLIPEKNKWSLSYANIVCNKFVLGSDQLWRERFLKETDFYTCLDWVESGKYKIAYATSFGVDYFEGNANMQKKMGYLLKRFQNISVREQSGVKLLKELYEIEAECVLDPVFLCEKRHYINMAERGKLRLPKGKYVGVYLLDITEEKEKSVDDAAAYISEGIYHTITQPGEIPEKDSKLKLLSDPRIEEWLAMIENCNFFITDSFHGLCFAIIFQKQFCVIFDKKNWRGLSRMRSLLDVLQLDERLVEPFQNQKILELCNKKIDYDFVNNLLLEQRRKSEIWFKNALGKSDYYRGKYDIHDYVWDLYSQLYQGIEKMENKNHKIRNDLFLASLKSKKKHISKQKRDIEFTQIIGWGAGECFRRNIHHIKTFYNMQYVCDKDPKKWGNVMEEGVVCISPDKLAGMENITVIIMVDYAAATLQIAGELLELGITCFDHVENWLSFVEGK